ncbi:MAG: HAD family hydrolase [Candidatus Acidiferrales bacterium]
MSKAVFLDRDGVINQSPPEGDYITRWVDFHILPGVAEGIALLNRAGFSAIVVTNQRGVAKGLMSEVDLQKMHERMTDELARAGANIDATLYCPHDIEARCDCRKPAPGMLLSAARLHGIDLRASWMIGDSDNDVEAGHSAGCKTARVIATDVTSSERTRISEAPITADIIASSLLDAIRQILKQEGIAIDSFSTAPAAS